MVEGCIQCPYHGWEYDGSGSCTRMPSTAFCKGIRVSALPVTEADGFVWVWPGQNRPKPRVPAVTQPPAGFDVSCSRHPSLLSYHLGQHLCLQVICSLQHKPLTGAAFSSSRGGVPPGTQTQAQLKLKNRLCACTATVRPAQHAEDSCCIWLPCRCTQS